MTTPTDPTATSLTTEALKKIGVTSPSATELSRSATWVQELFNDLWMRAFRDGNTRLVSLQNETVQISTKGKNSIDLAEDFDEEISVVILDGNYRGTCQTGSTSTTAKLSSSETVTAATAIGKLLLITGGTGSGQYRRITDYDATTKIATVESAWTSTPDTTSTYLVVNNPKQIDEDNVKVLDENNLAASIGRPTGFAKFNRKMYFDRPFDLSTYGVFYKYFMNINQVDLTEGASTRITRLYRNWHTVLDAGLQWKALADKDDARQGQFFGIYDKAATSLLIKEIAYGGEFEGFTT
jgi:hypothetical protein